MDEKTRDEQGDVKREGRISLKMWLVTLLVSIPAFLYGYVTAALNAAMITGDANSQGNCFHDIDDEDPGCPPGTIYNDILLTTFEAQLATSLVVVGGWIGSMTGGPLSDTYGRRHITLVNNWFFIIGGAMCSISNKWLLYFGRLIAGLGVGIECVVVPILLAEIATPATRGTITTVHQLLLTFGIFFVGILGYGLVTYVDHGWVYIQACSTIPALLMLLLSVYVPESPKWLIQKNRKEDAKIVLLDLRGHDANVEEEINEIKEEIKQDNVVTDIHGNVVNDDATWADVFACRFQMLVGIGLGIIAAATGINAIIFYSTQVFAFAGFDEAILATASVGAVNLLATALATYVIDVLGRKQLLEIGTGLMTVSLLVLALILLSNLSENVQGALAVITVLMYVTGFAIGIGAVMWVMMCEILDQRVRSKAFGLFISINWGINLVIGLVTLSAIDLLGGRSSGMDDDEEAKAEKNGVAYLFVIFGGICFLSQVFVRFYVPETKGKIPVDFVVSGKYSIFDTLSSIRFEEKIVTSPTCESIADSVPLLSSYS